MSRDRNSASGRMATPTLINLPPPPSDPVTPSEVPGTPNSTTTSMSELSTVAIKDGHRGHPHHHSHPLHLSSSGTSANTLEAERADRISRLAGMERVSTVRQSSGASLPAGASASHPHGYFGDAALAPGAKERSTVGSASATGSAGGHTTWPSDGETNEHDAADKMSEDLETSSNGGFSDEGNASLVGFGEGASSTVSGPVSTLPGTRSAQRQSAGVHPSKHHSGPSMTSTSASVVQQNRDARMIDGLTYDSAMPSSGRPPSRGSSAGDAPMITPPGEYHDNGRNPFDEVN